MFYLWLMCERYAAMSFVFPFPRTVVLVGVVFVFPACRVGIGSQAKILQSGSCDSRGLERAVCGPHPSPRWSFWI